MSKEKEETKSSKSTAKKTSGTTKKTSTASKKTTKKTTDSKTSTKAKKTSKTANEIKAEKKLEEVKKIDTAIDDYDDDYEYDEDLEDSYEEEDEENIEVVSPKKGKSSKEEAKKEDNKKEAKKEVSKEKILEIEKMAKDKNKKAKKKGNKSNEIGLFLEKNLVVITSFIIGVFVTVIIAFLIWPSRIATLKDGTQPVVKIGGKTYTANNLYDQMKQHYSVSQLLDAIDNNLLTKMYPEDEAMTKEVESNAEYYINMYKQYYNYTEDEFLSANGFESRDAYLEYLKLDYRRKKYETEYVKKNLTDKEIEDYYNDNVYGDIKCEHILIEVSSDNSSSSSKKKDSSSNKLSDEDAKKLAQEIIDKINDGTSWKDIKKEYKDKVTYENLGYQSWDSDLEDSFKSALKKMDNNSFSSEPVKTSYGYHVIHRVDQKKTPTLKKTKSKIIDKLVSQKTSKDSNLVYKALINLRKEKGIKFSDTDMKKKYDAYIKQYSKESTSDSKSSTSSN